MAGETYLWGPPLEGATTLAMFRVGRHHCGLLRIHPPFADQQHRPVKYRYSFEVKPPVLDGGGTVFFVTSEINVRAHLGEAAAGTHFLGVWEGSLHENLGAADKWGDLVSFTQRAFEISCERLGLKQIDVQPRLSAKLSGGTKVAVSKEIVEASLDLLL